MVPAMKRTALGLLLLLLFMLLAAEVAVRLVLPGAIVEPAAWNEAERDGLCGGVRYVTDGAGQRARATERLARPLAHPIVIVGGEFTAAPGLALAERYPERLEKRARAGGFSDVVALAVADREAALRRVVALPRASGATAADGGPPDSVVRHPVGPDVVILEIDASVYGGDASLFAIAAPDPPPPPFDFGALRVVDAWELFQLRRARKRDEAAIVDLVQRDGFTGRASSAMRQRIDRLTAAFHGGEPTADQLRFARGVLAEVHGLRRSLARAVAREQWGRLLTELRDAQRTAIVLVTGPTLPSLALVQVAEALGHAVVHAPPFELDAGLRHALPGAARPAALVHAQVADALWATLSKRGLLPTAAAAPAAVIERADAMEQSYFSRGGLEESAIRLVERAVDSHLILGPGALPLGILAGVAEGGRVAADGCFELVLRRPALARELVVRGELPAGSAIELERRARVARQLDVVRSRAQLLGPASGRSGFERVEWSFEPPPSEGPIGFDGLEFALATPTEFWLREVLYVVAPPDESER